MKLLKILSIVTLFLICASPLSVAARKQVIIDPGHGGKYTGTCGLTGNITGYCERDANLSVSLKLQSMLKEKGFDVRMTRTRDVDFSSYLSGNGGDLDMRMRVANGFVKGNNDNTIFLSVHHNAHPRNPYVKGIETYWYDGINHYDSRWPHDPLQIKYRKDSKRLAETIHPKLINNLNVNDRKVRSNQQFYVIRNAQVPSVLLELGFMTNRQEEARIKTNSYQSTAAKSVVDAVVEYYKVFEVYDQNQKRLAVYDSKQDAINYAEKQKKLVKVFDKYNQKYVYNNSQYAVYQKENGYINEYFSLDDAIKKAKSVKETRVVDTNEGWTLWSNYLSKKYAIYIGGQLEEEYFDYSLALEKAKKLSKATIVRKDINEVLWSNDPNEDGEKRTVNVNTLSGDYRIKTAVEVSKQLYPKGFPEDKKQKVAILATGDEAADALSAGPLSSVYGKAPILLTKAERLDSNVTRELKRLKAEKVIVIGGTNAISKKVESEIKRLKIDVERLDGASRYHTNRKILDKLGDVDGYFVASGEKYADALAVSPIAASQNWGIVLTQKENLPKGTIPYVKNTDIKVVGGEAVINASVEKVIKQNTNSVDRLAGTDRYNTLAKVLWEFKDGLTSNEILISTGQNFPDALASAPLAVQNPAPLILMNNNLKPNLESFIMWMSEKHKIDNVTVIGGTLNEQSVRDAVNKVR
jgi:N-acetylmuramoyl-L-alanine amidase